MVIVILQSEYTDQQMIFAETGIEDYEMLKQFIKFGIAGVFSTILNYVIYIVCIETGMHYIAANIIGFIITIFFTFILQDKFVFRQYGQEPWWRKLIKTYMSYAFTGLVLSNILSFLWIDVLHLENVLSPVYYYIRHYYAFSDIRMFIKWLAPILSMLIIIPLNFLISRFWTYGIKKKEYM